MNEVRLRRGEIVREGLHTTLADMRKMGREGWRAVCPETSMFILGRERAKLGYFWKHAYLKGRSGKHLGLVVNPDTHKPISTDDEFLDVRDFDKKRLHEMVDREKNGTTLHSPLWQADRNKIQRMAPADYMGRYMPEWFDYAIADEVHQLAGRHRTRQCSGGSGQSRKESCRAYRYSVSAAMPTISTTPCSGSMPRAWCGTDSRWGSAGKERFTQQFGVIETIERTKIEDNACSKKNKTEVTIRRKPGASPLLFGKYLMDTCAFVSLEDISDALPAYREDVVSVELAGKLKDAYQQLQDDITATLQEHRGNRSVLSTMLNALLVYPDHPYGLGTLYGSRYNPEIQQRETFVIAETEDLDEGEVYPKEEALIEEIKSQLARGRKCQVFAVYTNKYDVTARLEKLLRVEGIRDGCASSQHAHA